MSVRYEAVDNFKNALECLPILKGIVDWYHCQVYGSFARYMFECKEVGPDQVDEFVSHSDIDVKVCIKQRYKQSNMFAKLFKYIHEQGAVVEFTGKIYPIYSEGDEVKLDTEQPKFQTGYWNYGNYFVWIPYKYGYVKIDLCIYTHSVSPNEYYDFTVNNFLFSRTTGKVDEFKYCYRLEKSHISTMDDLDSRSIMPLYYKNGTQYSLAKRLFRMTKLWKKGYRIRTEEAKQAIRFMYEEGRKYKGPIYFYKNIHSCPSLPTIKESELREIYATKYEKNIITVQEIEEMPEIKEILGELLN